MGYRYIGSKDKLSEILIQEIKKTCPQAQTVIDLMAGTGLFSLALREQGYRVLASDVMTYSYHHLIVNLKLNDSPSFSGLKNVIGTHCTYEGVINYLNNIEPQNGFFTREFSPGGMPKAGCRPRMYFTKENASKIDAVRATIKKMV